MPRASPIASVPAPAPDFEDEDDDEDENEVDRGQPLIYFGSSASSLFRAVVGGMGA